MATNAAFAIYFTVFWDLARVSCSCFVRTIHAAVASLLKERRWGLCSALTKADFPSFSTALQECSLNACLFASSCLKSNQWKLDLWEINSLGEKKNPYQCWSVIITLSKKYIDYRQISFEFGRNHHASFPNRFWRLCVPRLAVNEALPLTAVQTAWSLRAYGSGMSVSQRCNLKLLYTIHPRFNWNDSDMKHIG